MKTFRQFNEEASKSLEDLKREYASSAAGRMQSRQAEVERARREAESREKTGDQFTQQRRREASTTTKQLKAKAAQQEQEAEQRRAAQHQQAQKRKQDTARLAARLKQAARGATRFVKSGARKLGNLIGRQ